MFLSVSPHKRSLGHAQIGGEITEGFARKDFDALDAAVEEMEQGRCEPVQQPINIVKTVLCCQPGLDHPYEEGAPSAPIDL